MILYVVLFLSLVPALRPVDKPTDLFKVNRHRNNALVNV
jgi:hypothetical protein